MEKFYECVFTEEQRIKMRKLPFESVTRSARIVQHRAEYAPSEEIQIEREIKEKTIREKY